MDIIKEISEQSPDAWKDFLVWALEECYEDWSERSSDVLGTLERYLLADVQAYLDNVNVRVEALYTLDGGFIFSYIDKNSKYWQFSDEKYNKPPFTTRIEALTAAIKKGMEIRNKNMKEKCKK